MTKESNLLKTYNIKSNIIDNNANDTTSKLFFFIKDNNICKFKEIFDKNKVNLEKKNEEGETILSMAVLANNYDIAKYLVDFNANVNNQNVRYIYIFKY